MRLERVADREDTRGARARFDVKAFHVDLRSGVSSSPPLILKLKLKSRVKLSWVTVQPVISVIVLKLISCMLMAFWMPVASAVNVE